MNESELIDLILLKYGILLNETKQNNRTTQEIKVLSATSYVNTYICAL